VPGARLTGLLRPGLHASCCGARPGRPAANQDPATGAAGIELLGQVSCLVQGVTGKEEQRRSITNDIADLAARGWAPLGWVRFLCPTQTWLFKGSTSHAWT
jgi:hypothetical protein